MTIGDPTGTVFDFTGAFGSAASKDGNTYTMSSIGDAWSGFSNEDTSVYPLAFPNGATITFTGESAAAVDVKFKFEKNPYPDTEPSFETASVTVNGAAAEYSVEIPAQDAANTFSSFLLYVVTQDQPVTLSNIQITLN